MKYFDLNVSTKTTIEQVEEFHRLVQLETIVDKPTIISRERMQLRLALMFEELAEIAQGAGCADLFKFIVINYLSQANHSPGKFSMLEVLDGLQDLQYVKDGTTLELGLQNLEQEAFVIVHNSNMTKLCNSLEEAEATVKHYKEERGINCAIEMVDNNKFRVYRIPDGKTLKSIGYTPATLGLINILQDGLETGNG